MGSLREAKPPSKIYQYKPELPYVIQVKIIESSK
jgi:hypothetical protein